MSEAIWIIAVATLISTVALICVAVFTILCRLDLKTLQGQLKALQDQDADSSRAALEAGKAMIDQLKTTQQNVQNTAQQVTQSFLQADDSFKNLVGGLRDLENLQQVKQRIDQLCTSLVDAHSKIGSQLGASGQIVDKLHQLVALWSKEGTELQAAYVALAKAVDAAISSEARTREKLSLQLETLLQAEAKGKGKGRDAA